MNWRTLSPQLLSLLRIVLAYLFIQVGSAKWFAFPAAVMPGGGTAPVGSLAWVAGVLEVVGGTLILFGLFTRPVAFILAGEMAFAYFMGHASQGHFFWPVLNQGALAVIYCFLFLYISSAGPGPWSLDALRERRESPPPVR